MVSDAPTGGDFVRELTEAGTAGRGERRAGSARADADDARIAQEQADDGRRVVATPMSLRDLKEASKLDYNALVSLELRSPSPPSDMPESVRSSSDRRSAEPTAGSGGGGEKPVTDGRQASGTIRESPNSVASAAGWTNATPVERTSKAAGTTAAPAAVNAPDAVRAKAATGAMAAPVLAARATNAAQNQARSNAATPAGAGRSPSALLRGLARATAPERTSRAQPEVVRQVHRALAEALRKGEGEVTVKLTPEALGKVTIRLRVEASQVTAKLTAETAAARDLLERGLPSLRAALEAQGLTVDRVEVGASGRESPVPGPEAPANMTSQSWSGDSSGDGQGEGRGPSSGGEGLDVEGGEGAMVGVALVLPIVQPAVFLVHEGNRLRLGVDAFA